MLKFLCIKLKAIHMKIFIENLRSKNTSTTTTIPSTNINGQVNTINGRLSSGIRRSSSSNTIPTVKQQPVVEAKAPIAQAECSDTDYDTARSIHQPISIDKRKNTNAITTENRQQRGYYLFI